MARARTIVNVMVANTLLTAAAAVVTAFARLTFGMFKVSTIGGETRDCAREVMSSNMAADKAVMVIWRMEKKLTMVMVMMAMVIMLMMSVLVLVARWNHARAYNGG